VKALATLLLGIAPIQASDLRLVPIAPLPGDAAPEDAQLHFANSRTGYLLSRDAVWRTDSGGAHWSRLSLPEHLPTFFSFSAAQFVPGGKGWLLLRDEHILATGSFGTTWRQIKSPIIDGVTDTCYFLKDGLTGWIAGGEYVRYSDRLARPNWAIEGRQDGLYVFSPVIYVTRDGGLTWARQALPRTPGYFIQHFHFADSRCGIAAAQSTVLVTHDGGRTWDVGIQGDVGFPSRVAHDTFMLDGNTAWVSFDDGSLLRTTDGGIHWANVLAVGGINDLEASAAPEHPVHPVHMWFWSSRDGLSVDQPGDHLCRTRNGGRCGRCYFPSGRFTPLTRLTQRKSESSLDTGWLG
jgi:photosystem II stability/assembly factor-like uncharacterized protein